LLGEVFYDLNKTLVVFAVVYILMHAGLPYVDDHCPKCYKNENVYSLISLISA